MHMDDDTLFDDVPSHYSWSNSWGASYLSNGWDDYVPSHFLDSNDRPLSSIARRRFRCQWAETNIKKRKISLGSKRSRRNYFDDGISSSSSDEEQKSRLDSNSDSDVTDDNDRDDYRWEDIDGAKQFKGKIGKLLASAFTDKSKGDFAGYESLLYAPNPGMLIEGLGLIGLPLSKLDANRIITQSEQAPFGKENKTIVDLTVRKTWQIDGTKIYFENPKWITYMEEQIIPKAAEKLGLDRDQVDAHLFKLLLYGEGGHFEAHQDTEKEPGMFGTLIIVLPSPFTGGSIPSSKHILPASVTSGYRLVLSYNLIFKNQSEVKPRVPLPDAAEQELRATLKDWLTDLDTGKDLPRFLMHVLDHKYSRIGLDFANIKGKDRAKVGFLRSIADELGLEIYIAQIDVRVEGLRDDDDSIGDARMNYYKLKDAVNPEGKEIDLSNMDFSKYDAVPRMHISGWELDQEDRAFTGNDGCEVTHYYFRTAVLLWPRSQQLFMRIRGAGCNTTQQRLQEAIHQYESKKTCTVADREDILMYARTAISAYLRPSQSECSVLVKSLLEGALVLNAPELFNETMERVRRRSNKVKSSDWTDAIKSFGFASLKQSVEKVLEGKNDMDHENSVWHCCFINDLVQSVPGDENLRLWSQEQRMLQLLNVNVFDDKALDFVISFVQQNSFPLCQQMLLDFIKNMEKAQAENSPEFSICNTPCQFIIKIFETFAHDEDAIEWSRNQLFRLVDCFGRKADRRDIQSVCTFIHLCQSNPARQSYIPSILEAFSRPAFDHLYIDNIICAFAEDMDRVLNENALSWQDEPYISFATHFYIAGTAILERPVPPLPDDYTIDEHNEYDSLLIGFLSSSLRHVLGISKSESVVEDVDSVARRLDYKVTYEVPEGDSKISDNCIIIRKAQSSPRNYTQSETRAFLKSLQSHEEMNVFCHQRKTCECCWKIQGCLSWLEDQRIYRRLCSALRKDLAATPNDAETIDPPLLPIQMLT